MPSTRASAGTDQPFGRGDSTALSVSFSHAAYAQFDVANERHVGSGIDELPDDALCQKVDHFAGAAHTVRPIEGDHATTDNYRDPQHKRHGAAEPDEHRSLRSRFEPFYAAKHREVEEAR